MFKQLDDRAFSKDLTGLFSFKKQSSNHLLYFNIKKVDT